MFFYLDEILVLTLVSFGVLFPAYLGTVPRPVIGDGFFRFGLGLSTVTGGLGVSLHWWLGSAPRGPLTAWLLLLLGLSAYLWNSPSTRWGLLGTVSGAGILALAQLTRAILPLPTFWIPFLVTIVGAGILAGIVFSMVLGHWYLNVSRLPVTLLKKATLTVGALLVLRLAWDLGALGTQVIEDAYGLATGLGTFIFQFEGLLLALALVLGVIMPLVLNLLILGTLKWQATRSATGLLYVAVLAVIFGDLFFKYYLFGYGLAL